MDVPHTIDPIFQVSDYYFVVLQDVHAMFGEDVDAVVVAEFTHGYE